MIYGTTTAYVDVKTIIFIMLFYIKDINGW